LPWGVQDVQRVIGDGKGKETRWEWESTSEYRDDIGSFNPGVMEEGTARREDWGGR